MKEMKENLKYSKNYRIEKEFTTDHIGIKVLSTPSLIYLIEKTSNIFIQEFLNKNETTVGIYIETNHLKPLKINKKITIRLNIDKYIDKKVFLSYEVYKKDNYDYLIATGNHQRYIVNKKKFKEKLE